MTAQLAFVEPLPGMGSTLDFSLREVDAATGLFALEAGDGSARLFVLDPAVYVPEYAPVLSEAQTSSLQLSTAEEALALVVANPATEGTTVNLLAPIVVNTSTGRAAQVILEGQDWPVRAPLAAP